ncbi:hypothetical protein HanLR1_Chr01g0002851 [Helianthus annuus]|nr:hypothetical protein HanHA89_Chr01g0003471 [Helianthus annuus]KAJ0781976.1 hypothetical protein HanLR1_Chr01g0002851 [Helianthus annuus]
MKSYKAPESRCHFLSLVSLSSSYLLQSSKMSKVTKVLNSNPKESIYKPRQ